MAKARYGEWLEPEKLLLIQGWKRNGLSDHEIAHNMGIAPRTLENWKKDHIQIVHALKIGKQQANFIIENELFRKAKQGNVTAMIFWLKNNWRSKYNDSQLSPEELALAHERRRKAKAEADITEFQAKELTAVENAPTSTTIINDIPMVKGEDHADSKTERAD